MDENISPSDIFDELFSAQVIVPLILGGLLILAGRGIGIETFWGLLLKEAGFALFVAVFVWIFFEVVSHKRQQTRMESLIERITRNVFFGVFRRDLPKGLIDETSSLVLEQQIVRKGFYVTYTLSDDTYLNADGEETPFVRLRGVTHFTIQNVGTDRCEVPIGVGLPNPIIPGLREHCRVNKLAVLDKDGNEKKTCNIATENETLQEKLKDESVVFADFTPFKQSLLPNEEVRITADYVIPKEVEDSEMLRTLLPADGLRLTVIDTNPDRRIIRSRSIHRKSLFDHSSPTEIGTHVFSLDYHLLPHQGIVIWWKNRPR